MPANWWRYRREEDYNEEQATRFAEWAKQRRHPPVKPPYGWPDDEDDGTQPPVGARPRVPVTGPNAAQAFREGAGRTLEAWKEALLEAGAGRPSAATGLELAGRLAAPALEWYGREVAEPAAGTALQGLRVVGEASPLLRDRMKPPLRPSLPRSLEEADTLRQQVGEEYRQWQEPFPGAKFGMEAVIDPLNVVPVTPVLKGARAGARMAGRGLREVGKEATVRALERAPAFADEPLVREGAEAVAGQVPPTSAVPEPPAVPTQDVAQVAQEAARQLPELSEVPPTITHPLARFTDVLYRETDAEQADWFVPNTNTRVDVTEKDIYVANTPDLALGQRGNRGVLLEFDAAPLRGRLDTSKPIWQASYEAGSAEFVAHGNDQSAYQQALRAITIKPDAQMAKPQKLRLERWLRGLEQEGWQQTRNPDGSVTWRRGQVPSVPAAPPTPPTAEPPAVGVPPAPASPMVRAVEAMARGASDAELQDMLTDWRARQQPEAVAAIEREIARRQAGAATSLGNAPEVATQPPGLPPSGAVPPTGVPPSPVEAPSPASVLPTAQLAATPPPPTPPGVLPGPPPPPRRQAPPTNPNLGNTQPTPPPSGRLSPLLRNKDEVEAQIAREGTLEHWARQAQRIPGVKKLEELTSPWTAAVTRLERTRLVFDNLEVQRQNIIRTDEALLRPAWQKVQQAGVKIDENARIVAGVRPKIPGMGNQRGYAWGDVFEHPERYDMPQELRDFITLGNRIEDELRRHGARDNVKLPTKDFGQGHHWGRLVEEVRTVENRGRPRPDMARHYDEMEAGIQAGVVYSTDPVAVALVNYDWLMRRHIGKMMADYTGEWGRTATQLIDPAVTARVEEADRIRQLWGKWAQTARNVRDGMAITYDMTSPQGAVQHILRSEVDAIGKEFAPLGQRIEAARQMADPLARRNTFDALYKEAQARAKEATKEWQKARSTRSRAMAQYTGAELPIAVEGAKFGRAEPYIGVGQLRQTWARGKLYPRDVADYLNAEFGQRRGNVAERANQAAGLLRTLPTLADYSVPFIQGLSALVFHPKAWATSVKAMVLDGLRPERHLEYLQQPDNLAVLQRLIPLGLNVEGMDVMEAAARGGALHTGARKVGELVGKLSSETAGRATERWLQRQVLERAETIFQAPINVLKIEMAKGLLPAAERSNQVEDLVQFLNNVTGTRSSQGMGTGASQRSFEGTFMAFSPRMMRSMFALVGDAVQGGLKGDEARKALGGQLIAVLGFAAVGRTLAGQPITPEMFDPRSSEFASFELWGRKVGIGGYVRGMFVTLAQSVRAAERDPSVFLDPLNRRENPLVRWWSGKASPVTTLLWDTAEKRDFLGEPFARPWENPPEFAGQVAKRMAPFAVQEYLPPYPEGQERLPLAGMVPELVGLRAIPFSPTKKRQDLADQYAKERYGRPWEELDAEERQQISQGHPDLEQARATARESQARRGNIVAQFWEDVEDERQRIRGETAALREQLAAGEIDGNAYREAIGEREMQMAQVVRHKRSSPQYAEVPLTQGEKQRYYGAGYKPSDKPLDLYLEAYYAVTELAQNPRTGQVDIDRLFALRDALNAASDPAVVTRAKNVISKNRDPDYVRAQEAMRQIMAIPRFGHQGVAAERGKQLEDALGQYYAMQRSLRRQTGGGRISRNYVLGELSRQQGGEMAQLAAEALSRARRPNPERRALEQQYADLLDRFYSDLRVPEVILEEEPELAGVR